MLKLWRRNRETTRLGDDVAFGRMRDVAYRVACQSALLGQAKVLSGYALCGASDFCIGRHPHFVTAACEAIRQRFEVGKQRNCKR